MAVRFAPLLVLLLVTPFALTQQQTAHPANSGKSAQSKSDSAKPAQSTSNDSLPDAPQPNPTPPPAQPQPAPPPQETTPDEQPAPSDGPLTDHPLPRSNSGPVSSSRDTQVDLSPPANDAKDHPYSSGPEGDSGDASEFHPFDPHRAMKDVEVGDFYAKRRNYRAAIARYREALLYKPNDAAATIALADALDKLGDSDEARSQFEAYLKILPHGPRSEEAHKALDRLRPKEVKQPGPASPPK